MARFSLVRSLMAFLALAFVAAQGCSKQGEGERCEPRAARNSDCDDGLICMPGDELLNAVETASDFGRCCPADGTYSDSRCAPRGSLGAAPDAGTAGTGGTGGEPSAGGAAGETSTAGSGGAGGTPSAAGAGGSDANGGQGGAPAAGGQGGAPSTAGAGGA